jgi:hypothetical protein
VKKRSEVETPEEFAEGCLPSSNWPDGLLWLLWQLPPAELDFDPDPEPRSVPLIDVWKSRRLAIAKKVRARDEAVRQERNDYWSERVEDVQRELDAWRANG